jgi:hypothetical protein
MPPISSASAIPSGTAIVIVLNPLPLLLTVLVLGVELALDAVAAEVGVASDDGDVVCVSLNDPEGLDMLRSGRWPALLVQVTDRGV